MTDDGRPASAPDRRLPSERGVVAERPELGGGAATASFALPDDAGDGLPGAPAPLAVGPVTFHWGSRTFVMGVLNVTPDSFSGDGLLAADDPVAAAVRQAEAMVAEGADILDIGGASSRPGHATLDPAEETDRVLPVLRAVAAALPGTPLSIDTTSPAVAAAALDAGAHLLNDIWGVADDDRMLRLAASRGVPIVLMHNRAEARYRNLVPEVVADLQRAIERALDAGVPWDHLVVDPGFGFGKTPDHNLALLGDLAAIGLLGRPILLGTSRKSTLGKVLDLPPGERVEATTATTALAIAAGVDMVRVHDVRENVRVARVSDAVVRGWRPDGWETTR
ncbi:MAG TPA: dihydropteroate synthase [Candidatus Limnocylindrales bacterium]|nr:dihydropteroate synthase [Candidatus Limnocylindrales bacterium]